MLLGSGRWVSRATFLKGSGRVEAAAGVLRLHDLTPGLDGSVVLRYHSVPYLEARPAVAIEQEYPGGRPGPVHSFAATSRDERRRARASSPGRALVVRVLE